MKTLPKIFLIGSVVLFAVSLTGAGGAVHFGLLKPLSALLFGAYFITNLVTRLDPEEYAADQRLRNELMRATTASVRLPSEPPIGAKESLAA